MKSIPCFGLRGDGEKANQGNIQIGGEQGEHKGRPYALGLGGRQMSDLWLAKTSFFHVKNTYQPISSLYETILSILDKPHRLW